MYDIGKTRLYQTTKYTSFFTFYMLCLFKLSKPISLVYKHIVYKPFGFLHPVI